MENITSPEVNMRMREEETLKCTKINVYVVVIDEHVVPPERAFTEQVNSVLNDEGQRMTRPQRRKGYWSFLGTVRLK